jgi:hypothetical protein
VGEKVWDFITSAFKKLGLSCCYTDQDYHKKLSYSQVVEIHSVQMKILFILNS